jgi:hypothetical protein
MQKTQYFAYAAVVVGFIIRLLKDDTKLPTIPARARPWLSMLFGLVALAIDKLAVGSTWQEAIINGAIVGGLPIVAHQLGVESLFGGKEFPLPKALVTADPPKPDGAS